MAEESLCQHYAHLLVVGYLRHLLLMLRLCHTEVLQQLGGLAFCLIAVHLGKLHFQLSCLHTVFLRHVGTFSIECLAGLHIVPHGLMSHQYGVHHGESIVFEVILLQYAHTLTG